MITARVANALVVEADRHLLFFDGLLVLHDGARPLIGNDAATTELHRLRQTVVGLRLLNASRVSGEVDSGSTMNDAHKRGPSLGYSVNDCSAPSPGRVGALHPTTVHASDTRSFARRVPEDERTPLAYRTFPRQ